MRRRLPRVRWLWTTRATCISPTRNYNRIREVNAATGTITTFAGGGTGGDGSLAAQAALSQPTGLAIDAAGNVYFADQATFRVRRVDAATGLITTVAGTGVEFRISGSMPGAAYASPPPDLTRSIRGSTISAPP